MSDNTMLLGLRSQIYPTSDLEVDKQWWSAVLDLQPYFDEPFYVGFNVGGYELGLDPNASAEGHPHPATFWGVEDIEAALKYFVQSGSRALEGIKDVGGGIKMVTMESPSGARIGLIENPHFRAK